MLMAILTFVDDNTLEFVELLISQLVIILAIVIFLILYYRWCKTHKRPLNDEEIQRLSLKRINKEINRINRQVGQFSEGYYKKNGCLNSNGGFSDCNIKANEFPSYISSQLYGKKHEWLVLGLVKDGYVIKYWSNKGSDNSNVSLRTSISHIMNVCLELGCTAILDLHNHPNSNPNRYDCSKPSRQDIATSKEWAKTVNSSGISLFSFVTERGKCVLYYKHFTNKLQIYPINTKIEYIKKENGISEEQNLKLHKELGLFHR